MDADPPKFMLLEDCMGSIVYQTGSRIMGAFKKLTQRSHSFQALKGMLFELELDHWNVVDIVSCENNEYHIERCPLNDLKLLTDNEFNLLLAIPSYYDRVEVCRPGLYGGKCKLQHGVEAREDSVVEVYDMTGKVKTRIGHIQYKGPNKDLDKKGTYFGVVLADAPYPQISHYAVHELNFLLTVKEVSGDSLERESANDEKLIDLVKQQKEILQKIEENSTASLLPVSSIPAHGTVLIPAPAPAPIPPSPSTQIPKEVAALCECPICFNFFHEPKSLQCEHHFCKDCLGELVKFNENELPYITCPTCNSVHLFAGKNDTLESLKCQLFLKQLLDSYCGSMNINEGPRCCDKPVHWYCGDCRRYLCDECFRALDGKACNNKTSVRYSRSKESILPYCEVHRMLQYWGCDSCSCTVCPYCMTKDHRHHWIISLVEYAELRKGNLVNAMNCTKNQSKKIEKYLSDESNDARKTIRKRADDIVAMVRDVELNILQKAELLWKTERHQLEGKLKENSELLQKAQLVQKQGNVGVIWGSSKLVEIASVCSETGLHESNVQVVDNYLYGTDGESAVLNALINHFQDLRIPCLDRYGNKVEKKIDVAVAGK